MRFKHYTITTDGQSVVDFPHPGASVRRHKWTALTGDTNYVPPPYLPTSSAIKIHSTDEMPCTGGLVVMQQLSNLSGFVVDADTLALCDGAIGLLLKRQGDGYTCRAADSTRLDFTDHWHETDTGVIGVNCQGVVTTWLCHNAESPPPLMPTGFQHVGGGRYLHNSLRFSTSSLCQAEIWAQRYDEDANNGRSVLVDWREDKFTIMDATAPDRCFTTFHKLSDDEEVEKWTPVVKKEHARPVPEHATQEDPYNSYVETVYHIPLYVDGKTYSIRDDLALCVGTTRTNLRCKEVYILHISKNVWSRLSNWNEENVERKFVPPNVLISFRFTPNIGWAVKGVRFIRI